MGCRLVGCLLLDCALIDCELDKKASHFNYCTLTQVTIKNSSCLSGGCNEYNSDVKLKLGSRFVDIPVWNELHITGLAHVHSAAVEK